MSRWYKRCGADFIHGTMMLTLEEKGAYSLCLDLIYDRGGPIPDDARWISGVCGVSIRKWNSIRERLLELGKLASENGMLSNRRADFELVSAELSSRERAESGAKGGRKRAENASTPNENNGLVQAELNRIEEIRGEVEEKDEATPHLSPRLPISEAFDSWNEDARLAGWPLVTARSDERKRHLRPRLREHGLDGWKAALKRARASPFLGHDPPTWFTFDWLLKPANFTKLIEGNYDRKRSDNLPAQRPSGWETAFHSNMPAAGHG